MKTLNKFFIIVLILIIVFSIWRYGFSNEEVITGLVTVVQENAYNPSIELMTISFLLVAILGFISMYLLKSLKDPNEEDSEYIIVKVPKQNQNSY